MPVYALDYLFNDEVRTHRLELKQSTLAAHEAAMHLLQLHFGDAENSLMMPAADATPAEILEQAQHVGLTRIQVSSEAEK